MAKHVDQMKYHVNITVNTTNCGLKQK